MIRARRDRGRGSPRRPLPGYLRREAPTRAWRAITGSKVSSADDVPRDCPLWLVGEGWIHPTDSSINVAVGQGEQTKPQGLVLEVPTSGGGWEVARPTSGFPAGKNKTVLIDLDGVFRPGAARRFRLRTNLEIYWDSLAIAEACPKLP